MGIFLQLYVSHIIALPLQIERWSMRWLRIMSYQMTWSYLEEIVTHIFTTFLLWSWFLCIENVSYINGLKRMIYYIVHNSKQKIDDRKILMFIYESYLKESKKHARVLWKDTFISIWSQYLLIQIRKWIYVTTFKTTPLTEMNNGVK